MLTCQHGWTFAVSLPFSVKFALRLASTCFICCRICLCPAVPSTRKDSSPMPTVIVPHPVKHGKRVVVYLPDESDSWTAAELRAAIDTSLCLKYGMSAPAIDTAHMGGRLESCNVEVSTEEKEKCLTCSKQRSSSKQTLTPETLVLASSGG